MSIAVKAEKDWCNAG